MRRVFCFAVGVCFVVSSPALAFHDGGVADCGGCHTMHNSEDGQPVDPDSPDGNAWLLRDATPSDVCLSCHATRSGAVFGSDPLNPPRQIGGGNFVFLLEDNLNDGHGGATDPIPGEAGGHSIVAPSKGVAADGTLSEAPGGTFPASQLGCSSCHDPHGNPDFRLLHGVGPIQDGLHVFANPAPVAEGITLRTSDPPESDTYHTAYQSGMSQWCGNCHGDFHNSGDLVHPSGVSLGAIATAYDLYNGTSDPTGGSHADAYLAAVPFEDPANTTTSTAGPSATSKVSCVTCHRAHATSAPNAGRWDFNVTFLHEDGAESGSYQIPDPYGDVNQRSLCNKCHVKDANDAPFEP